MAFTKLNHAILDVETITQLAKTNNSFMILSTELNNNLASELRNKGNVIVKNFSKENAKNELKELNYDSLSKEYPTLIANKLCDGKDLIFKCFTLWKDFENLALEFCDNKDHYGLDTPRTHAEFCEKILMYNGFLTQGVFNGDKFIIYASKNTKPIIYNDEPSPLSFNYPHGPNEPSPFEDDWR